jgi:PAS domain S-box-containing protein
MNTEQNKITNNSGKQRPVLEILIIIAFCITIYIFAANYDILEGMVELSRQHENWELDEILTVSIFLVFVLSFFSMRRWQDVRQTEIALNNSEQKYRTLFEASADALSILDVDTGKFLECNSAAVKLHDTQTREIFLGLTPGQISPKYQSKSKSSDKLAMEHIQKAFAEGTNVFEWTHCKNDGSPFPALVSLSALKLGEKNLILASGRDMTEIKQSERELEKSIKKLQITLKEVKTLQGIIPICSYCKKIRDDKGVWDILEAYICEHSDAQFSHGICPECYKKQMKEMER